jgi:hypothetical protein
MNTIDSNIIKQFLAACDEHKLLSSKSLNKLKDLMISGKMKEEDWIAIFDFDRTDIKEGQNEN